MAIREGRWDCPSCGNKGILGRHTSCNQCGRPRPQGIKFYLPENTSTLSDPELMAIANAGADWICQYCSASNRTADKFCTQCGAERGTSESQTVKTYELANVPRSSDRPSSPSHVMNHKELAKTSSWLSLLSFKHGKRAIATLVLSLTVGSGTWFVMPRSLSTTVSSVSWERQILIEHYVTVTESDWSVPPGGRLVSQRQDIKDYRQVLDHYETRTRNVSKRVAVGTETYVCGQKDLGNGFFEDETCSRTVYETRTHTETYEEPIYRQEPIYATKYTYDIERWMTARTETTTGNDSNPIWATVSLASNEREAERQENYSVLFTDPKGNTRQYTFNETEWSTFAVGESCMLRYQYGQLQDIDCDEQT